MATQITGSNRDQETSGKGIQSKSALGQKRTYAVQQGMSALLLKADIFGGPHLSQIVF